MRRSGLTVGAHNVSRDDAADELDHAVDDAGHAVDGDHAVGVKRPIIREVVVRSARGPEGAARRCVDDEDDGGEDRKDEDGDGEEDACLPTLHQRGDEDGAEALEGLVEALEQADATEGDGRVATYAGGVVVAIRCEGDEGADEDFETELVYHNSQDIDHHILLLGACEEIPCCEDIPALGIQHSRKLCHCGVLLWWPDV